MFGKLFSRKKTPPQTWRQGDVFIVATKFLPPNLRPQPPVLAEGEVTGHSHRLGAASQAQVLTDAGGKIFLEVSGGKATVVHEEHGPITVPCGTYMIRIQREYHPQEIRRVID